MPFQAAVAVRYFGKILLVKVLGIVERRCGDNLGGNVTVTARLQLCLERGLRRLGLGLLLIGKGVDA